MRLVLLPIICRFSICRYSFYATSFIHQFSFHWSLILSFAIPVKFVTQIFNLLIIPCCLTNAAYNSLPKSILNTWRMLLYSCVWQVEVATAYCGWVHSDTPFTWRLLSHNCVQLKLKIVQFSRLPPPCPSTSKIPPPCWPWMSNFKRKNPLPPPHLCKW